MMPTNGPNAAEPTSLDVRGALIVAQAWLREHAADAVVREELTQAHSFGWIFFYQSRRFVETGHSSDQLAGNAPIIVDSSDGSVHVTGTAKPLQHYITAYEASKRPARETCPACGRILDGRMDLALTLREEGGQTAKACKQVFHCPACERRSWRWNDRQTENHQLVAR